MCWIRGQDADDEGDRESDREATCIGFGPEPTVAAGLVAAGAGWFIGKIALGLRADYLAIATLGISEIIIAIIKYEEWLSRGVKNVTGIPWNSLVPEDGSAFQWMHEIISYEPAEAFGKELLGRLASVGIVQGKPFNPDARMQKIFEQAAYELAKAVDSGEQLVVGVNSFQVEEEVEPELQRVDEAQGLRGHQPLQQRQREAAPAQLLEGPTLIDERSEEQREEHRIFIELVEALSASEG